VPDNNIIQAMQKTTAPAIFLQIRVAFIMNSFTEYIDCVGHDGPLAPFLIRDGYSTCKGI